MQFLRSRSSFETFLAANWPLLWSHRPLLVLFGCIVGVLISLCIGTSAFFVSQEMPDILSLLVYLPSFVMMFIWLQVVIRVPIPTNVIVYIISPKVTTMLIVFGAIMLGPIVSTICIGDKMGITDPFLLHMFALQILAMGTFFCYARASDDLLSYPGILGIISSIIGIILCRWIEIGAVLISAAIFCIVLFAFLRLLLCIRAGKRTARDGGLMNVGVLLPVIGIVFGLTSTGRDFGTSVRLSATATALDLSTSYFKIFGIDGPLIVLAVIVTAVWIDLSNWGLARFWLLPKVDS